MCGSSGGSLLHLLRLLVLKLFASILLCHLALVFGLIGIVSAWVLLAAVLNPNRFLPYGTAIVVLVVVAGTVGSAMLDALAKLTSRLRHAFLKALRHKLEKARAAIEREIAEELSLANNITSSPSGYDPFESSEGDRKGADADDDQPEVTAADIFALLVERHASEKASTTMPAVVATSKEAVAMAGDDSQLAIADFRRLFQLLELHFTASEEERLFAMTDLDGSGFVTAAEWEAAWDDLTDEMITRLVSEAGLSRQRVLGMVAALVGLLIVFFIFLFTTLSGWYSQKSFDAVVQSTLFAFVGRIAIACRGKAKAEAADNEELSRMVDGMLGEQRGKSEDE